jgi:hypothetical protein
MTAVSVDSLLALDFARANLALRSFSGVFSVGLGFFIVYEKGVLNRLFA